MNKQTIQELEELLRFAPADGLRQSVQHVFFAYLINNTEVFTHDHKKIVEDFYFLMNFLDKANRSHKSLKSN